jgi:type II secretory pathway component PulK
MRRIQEGSASIVVLVLLTLLAAAAAGAASLLQVSLRSLRASEEVSAVRRSLEREADRVLAALAADPTPDADSPLDPVWSLLAEPEADGVVLGLADASSALDPNWVQKNVFTRTGLASLLSSSSAADELQQRREDLGFSLNLSEAYGDLFADGALDRYCTPYGIANINVTDEFALRSLYALRTGDAAAAEVFHTRVQQHLRELRVLRPEDVQAFLGPGYDALYPVVSAEPCMNVHFLDPLILAELLAYPALAVPHPQASARAILASRTRSELSSAGLLALVAAPTASRIYQYLGVVTWFWRLTVAARHARLELVVARLPGRPGEPARFQVVETRYGRS